MNHSVTRLFADTLDHYFSPYARKLSQSPHLIALRDGFQISMPFVFIGCIFVPLIFPLTSALSIGETSSIALWWESLSIRLQPVILPMYQITLGLVAMIISFGISASLAKQYRLPERLSGLTGCLAFLMLSGFSTLNTQELYYLGGGGIFTALVAGIYAVEVIHLFIKKGWYIHMPDDVPLITAQGFKLLIPIFIVFLTLSLFDLTLKYYAGVHFPHLIETLFKPLILASDSLAAVIISILVCQLLWFVGIHGSIIITSIMNPFWMTNLLANQAAIETGVQIPPHIYTASFWDFFLLIGGVGSTLPLVYLALKSRSNHMKSVGKVALLPAIFNINEPILFGFPIIMNPVFILPFIFVPILNATIAWYLTSIGVLDRIVMMLPWTVPAPLGATWAANGSIANVLMVLFALVNAYCLYLPFFRAHEKIILAQQEQMAAQKH
ncbi:PTS sugar transporter subunit IIC [Vibrio gazogenes]|uniref:Permease IIC component n=1 Tax=Vibrio gazogenes TaxID=687 RepID=A0A1Z2SFD9_VIBGA|nr:PTS transporter subunit EIIC [Vibrio gazogenes]ASA55886.1 PTS cellobiose transporter subunit IIC [Vibrio gazogenes]